MCNQDIRIIVQINNLALAILGNFFFFQSLNNEDKLIKNESIYLIFGLRNFTTGKIKPQKYET